MQLIKLLWPQRSSKTCKTCAQKQHLSVSLNALLRLTYITLQNLQKSCHAASVSAGRPGLAGPAAPANVLDTREQLCSHMLENSRKMELSRSLSINNSIREMWFPSEDQEERAASNNRSFLDCDVNFLSACVVHTGLSCLCNDLPNCKMSWWRQERPEMMTNE